MKRYRDYKIVLPDDASAIALQTELETKAVSVGLQVENKKGEGYGGLYSVFVIGGNEFPKVRLILFANQNVSHWELSIVNIVPTIDSGCSSLTEKVYNQILQYFVDAVVEPVNDNRYDVDTNSEEYTLQDLIPHSWSVLETWVQACPLSRHPLDQSRWMDFVVSLYRNKEHLPLSDFEAWLKSEYEWSDDDISYFSSRLEYGLELLEKFDGCDAR